MSEARTKEALEKIKTILAEHDLWGCITVSDTERLHWIYHFDVSWSCLYLDVKTGHVRIRAVGHEFKTPEQHHEVLQQTTGAIFNTRDYATMLFHHMDIVARKIQEKVEVEHHPFSDFKIEGKP